MFVIRLLSVVVLALAANPILAGGDHDSEFVHEWAGVFPLADTTHQYLMQSKNGTYADPNMKIVLIPTFEVNMEGIHATEGGVAALMVGECETIENNGTGSAITPTGACFDLVVDDSIDTNTFVLTTTGIDGVALYTQHVPYEFERDTHFFKDSDGNDVEPKAEETMEGGHAHGHGHDHDKEEDHGDGEKEDHGHGHEHGPEHPHDHGHEEEEEHKHDMEENHGHGHEHGSEHPHDHGHEEDEEHQHDKEEDHGHGHEHGPEHPHDHDHSGAANLGGLVGSAVAGAIVAAAL